MKFKSTIKIYLLSKNHEIKLICNLFHSFFGTLLRKFIQIKFSCISIFPESISTQNFPVKSIRESLSMRISKRISRVYLSEKLFPLKVCTPNYLTLKLHFVFPSWRPKNLVILFKKMTTTILLLLRAKSLKVLIKPDPRVELQLVWCSDWNIERVGMSFKSWNKIQKDHWIFAS